jgi:hypothetical protein
MASERWIARPISVAHIIRRSRLGRMRVGPQARGNGEGINPLALPPGVLVAATMKLSVVQPADRHGEAVADPAPHRSLLCELDVVRI